MLNRVNNPRRTHNAIVVGQLRQLGVRQVLANNVSDPRVQIQRIHTAIGNNHVFQLVGRRLSEAVNVHNHARHQIRPLCYCVVVLRLKLFRFLPHVVAEAGRHFEKRRRRIGFVRHRFNTAPTSPTDIYIVKLDIALLLVFLELGSLGSRIELLNERLARVALAVGFVEQKIVRRVRLRRRREHIASGIGSVRRLKELAVALVHAGRRRVAHMVQPLMPFCKTYQLVFQRKKKETSL